MAVKDRVATIKANKAAAEIRRAVGRAWNSAVNRLMAAIDAMPNGTSANDWEFRFEEWLSAAKEVETLSQTRQQPANTGGPSYNPLTRIGILAPRFFGSDPDNVYLATAGDIVSAAISVKAKSKFKSELAAALGLDYGLDLVRRHLDEFAWITFLDSPDWSIHAAYPSLGEYFLALKEQKKWTPSEILDHWQAKPLAEQKKICPSNFGLIQTDQRDGDGRPSRKHLIENVRAQMNRAKS